VTEKYTTSGISSESVSNPKSWAKVVIEGIGMNFRAFSTTSTYSNHIALNTGTSASMSAIDYAGETRTQQCIQGNRLYGGTTGYIRISGKTSDPAGSNILFSVDVKPAFKLNNGVQYYKETITRAHIPSR
jgi:hypothetical protein